MRFLADENCDFAVVRALRAAGHDVRTIGETAARSTDREVMQMARDDGRIMLTEDKGFGQLAHAGPAANVGIILFRWPSSKRGQLGEAIVRLVAEQGERLGGRFVVVEPGRIRISPPRGDQ